MGAQWARHLAGAAAAVAALSTALEHCATHRSAAPPHARRRLALTLTSLLT